MVLLPGSLLLFSVFTKAVSGDLAPRFNAITKNVTIVVGQTAVLPCSVKSLGSFKIVWLSPKQKTLTLEDRRITEDERVSLERPYTDEWNLHVREVAMKDTGVYTCQINTDPVQVRPVQLIIHQPATIIDHLSSATEIKVREGDMVELVCNVTGFPAPDVTWYRIPKGLIENNDREKKNVGTGGEVLLIRNVTRYCDDDYECVAFNGVTPAASRKMRVRVEFPPEVVLPNKKMGQVLGGYTILECQVTAYPLIMTVWRHNGQDIISRGTKYSTEVYTDGPNKITLTLKIQSITSVDYGDYECWSENFLGKDSEIMTLYEFRKKTTPKLTTTTTTTTVAPWRRVPNRYDEDKDFDDHRRGDNRQINPYGENNGDRHINGRESKLQMETDENNRRNLGRNKNRDGTIQSVISDPQNSSTVGKFDIVQVTLSILIPVIYNSVSLR